MTDLKGILEASLALTAGPIVFLRGFRILRKRRLIADTPTARIRSLAMGLVEVNGKVAPRSTVIAPFSARSCAYWEIDISSRSKNGWSVLHRDQSGNPFFLSDETGEALVYPHGAECKIPFGTDEQCSGLNLPPCYAEYLKAHGSVLITLERAGRLRFRERVLEGGENVYVLGTAVPRPREVVVADSDLLQATGTDDAATTRLRALDHEVVAVIRRGENETVFIISQESERALMLEFGGQALLQLTLGPALALFGLGYWLLMLSSGRWP